MLAIYGAVRFSGTFKTQSDSELAKKLSIIIDPMQAGFAEGKSSIIKFSQETLINNKCENEEYGSNRISASTKLNNGKWGNAGAETSIVNKYLFSDSSGAKDYTIFSKPFYLGFKIADLLFITSEDYCFINPPEEIESDIKSFNLNNFKLNSENCAEASIRVCFNSHIAGGSSCNITIFGLCTDCENGYERGFVEKDGQRFYYTGNLLYAGLISDYATYNCNVRRLFYRASKLADLYNKKGDLMASRDCFSGLSTQLESYSTLMETASKLQRFDSVINSVDMLAKELDKQNSEESCEIW